MSEDERQPAATPMTAEDWARDRLGGLYRWHRAGWLRAVRVRGMLTIYQSPDAWQSDFEAWAARVAR